MFACTINPRGTIEEKKLVNNELEALRGMVNSQKMRSIENNFN